MSSLLAAARNIPCSLLDISCSPQPPRVLLFHCIERRIKQFFEDTNSWSKVPALVQQDPVLSTLIVPETYEKLSRQYAFDLICSMSGLSGSTPEQQESIEVAIGWCMQQEESHDFLSHLHETVSLKRAEILHILSSCLAVLNNKSSEDKTVDLPVDHLPAINGHHRQLHDFDEDLIKYLWTGLQHLRKENLNDTLKRWLKTFYSFSNTLKGKHHANISKPARTYLQLMKMAEIFFSCCQLCELEEALPHFIRDLQREKEEHRTSDMERVFGLMTRLQESLNDQKNSNDLLQTYFVLLLQWLVQQLQPGSLQHATHDQKDTFQEKSMNDSDGDFASLQFIFEVLNYQAASQSPRQDAASHVPPEAWDDDEASRLRREGLISKFPLTFDARLHLFEILAERVKPADHHGTSRGSMWWEAFLPDRVEEELTRFQETSPPVDSSAVLKRYVPTNYSVFFPDGAVPADPIFQQPLAHIFFEFCAKQLGQDRDSTLSDWLKRTSEHISAATAEVQGNHVTGVLSSTAYIRCLIDHMSCAKVIQTVWNPEKGKISYDENWFNAIDKYLAIDAWPYNWTYFAAKLVRCHGECYAMAFLEHLEKAWSLQHSQLASLRSEDGQQQTTPVLSPKPMKFPSSFERMEQDEFAEQMFKQRKELARFYDGDFNEQFSVCVRRKNFRPLVDWWVRLRRATFKSEALKTLSVERAAGLCLFLKIYREYFLRQQKLPVASRLLESLTKSEMVTRNYRLVRFSLRLLLNGVQETWCKSVQEIFAKGTTLPPKTDMLCKLLMDILLVAIYNPQNCLSESLLEEVKENNRTHPFGDLLHDLHEGDSANASCFDFDVNGYPRSGYFFLKPTTHYFCGLLHYACRLLVSVLEDDDKGAQKLVAAFPQLKTIGTKGLQEHCVHQMHKMLNLIMQEENLATLAEAGKLVSAFLAQLISFKNRLRRSSISRHVVEQAFEGSVISSGILHFTKGGGEAEHASQWLQCVKRDEPHFRLSHCFQLLSDQ